jgi:hypothetical protein
MLSRKHVAEEVARHSFDEAVASIKRTTGGKVPKRQSEEIAVEASRDFTASMPGVRPRQRRTPAPPWS